MGARRWLITAGLVFATLSAQAQEDPLSALSAEQQFLNRLQMSQERNRQGIRQSEQEILSLESRMAANDEEAARHDRELGALNATPMQSPAEQLQQAEARHRTRALLEQARAERARMEAELGRRHREREQLVQEQKKLRQLESEYRIDPGRADELMRELR